MWREKIKSILSWQKGREAKGRAEKKEFPELRGKQDKKELFQKAILQESRKAIQNPGCGWYHLYTFNAAQTGEPLYIACEEEELVLLRIDIGAFWDKPISEPSLEWIRRILAFFREKRKGMILRFSYDLEGKGLEKEPGSIRLVEEHMQQIGEVIREYADDIFAVQGILIGNWGEMHGSRYLTPDAFRTLTDTMIKAVDGACPVAVRKPAQWRELTLGWTEQEKKKLTLFNDGIFDRKRILERMAHCHRKHRDRKSAAGKKNWNGRKTKCAENFAAERPYGEVGQNRLLSSRPQKQWRISKECIFPI